MELISSMLVSMWVADLATLSKPLVVWTLLPMLWYGLMMCVKWAFVFTPVWLPISLVLAMVYKETKSSAATETEKPQAAPYKLEVVESKTPTIQ